MPAMGQNDPYYKGPSDAELAPRNALVLGISRYNESIFPRLENPIKDAKLIADSLKKLGFEVYPKDDPTPLTRQKFKAILYDYVRQVKKSGGASLFYFAGHGLSYDGASYLVPFDGMALYSRDMREELIPLDLLSDALVEMNNAFHIVIIDACRDPGIGKLPRLGDGEIDEVTAGIGFKPPGDILYATSADMGQKARDGINNSPYAEALTKYISAPNQPVEMMFKKVLQYFKTLPGNSGKNAQTPVVLYKGGASFFFAPTKETYDDEKKVWDLINKPDARSGDYDIFLNGYPVGYFARQAVIRRSQAPTNLVDISAVKVAADNLRFRAKPSLGSHVAASFKSGAMLRALGHEQSESMEWTMVVRENGDIGYVASRHLNPVASLEKKLTLTYVEGSEVPIENWTSVMDNLKLSNLVKINLVGHVSGNVGTTILRIANIRSLLAEQNINPDVVHSRLQAAVDPSQANQIEIVAETIPLVTQPFLTAK